VSVHRATGEGSEQTIVLTGTERRQMVRSVKLARFAQVALARVNAHKQGKKVDRDADSLRHAAAAILKEHRVEDMLRFHIEEQVTERAVRASGTHPTAVRVERTVRLHREVDKTAVSVAAGRRGRCAIATNHLQHTLSLPQAVLAYREAYLGERGHPLALCLRILTVLE
jgi:transposase